MDYITYWSVLDTPSKSIQSTSVFLSATIIAGISWLVTKKFKKNNNDGEKTILLWIIGAFAVIGLAGYILLTCFYSDKSNARELEILNSPSTTRIEGVVSNFERTFRKTTYGNETIEKFSVDSIQFAYGDALMGKFNSFSQTENSVIVNGRKVRITYKSGSPYGDNYKSILKLEIEK